MTMHVRRSFPIALVVSSGIAAVAAPDALAIWPLLAPVAFSSALMLWAVLTGPSSLNATMQRHLEVTP